MKKLTTFQIIVTGAFIFFAVVGVLIFAGIGGFGGGKSQIGAVTIWGTYDSAVMNAILSDLKNTNSQFNQVTYVKKDPKTFDAELVEALAAGTGPDVFFLKQDTVVRHRNKIYPIPYATMSARTFKDSYIQEGELFLSPDGILALPFSIDPVVLYWNRDQYAQAGISRPPQFWDELLGYAANGVLTTRGDGGAIVKSAFAIGTYSNISHAKELLSLLILQAGSMIVEESQGRLVSELHARSADGQSPVENALRFYTDFANPSKSVYTWNRALPEAQKAFASGVLANYAGFASELPLIRRQNANLNFDIALIPQVRKSGRVVTYGDMIGLAVSRGAQNLAGGVQVALTLTQDAALQKFSDTTGLAPVSRTLLATRPTDPFKAIFADAALQSGAWLDPSTIETEAVFQRMIESVLSGRLRVSDAVSTADKELGNLLQ